MGRSRQGKANHILRQDRVEQMMTPQKADFGLGFRLSTREGAGWFGHNGADEGFQPLLTCSVDGAGMAVMVNSDNGIRLVDEIELAVARAWEWKGARAPVLTSVKPVTTEALSVYFGAYQSPKLKLRIEAEGDHLLIVVSPTNKMKLLAEPGGGSVLRQQRR